jgi:hypothetical protein
MIRFLRAASAAALFALLAASTTRCAESKCKFNSDCARGQQCVAGECVVECQASVDCPKERPTCDRGTCVATGVDAGDTDGAPVLDSMLDSTLDSMSPDDTSVPPTDTSPPPSDTTTGGTKAYLTSCGSDAECASAACATGPTRFCTKICTSHADCGDGLLCSGGKCALDDTGATGCDLASGSPCKEFCYGTASAHACTHGCATAAECPAGYACSPVSSGKKVCVEIERPCATADACASGLGFCGSGGLGCTAKCDTAADCPQRLVGLPAYTCEVKSGQKVCVPPSDVLGADPLGASCSSSGTNTCRSGACDDGVSPPMCNQRCTVRGGCGRGFGCFPLEDPGPPKQTLLVCTAATGTGWLGDACTRARDCITGICQAPGYCTRLCVDGLCPTGMSCVAAPLTATDGTPIKLCSK